MIRVLKILMVCIILGLPGCINYQQIAINKYDIPDTECYCIIHQGQDKMFLYDVELKNDSISGVLCSRIDKSLESKFLHLYLHSNFQLPQKDHTHITIPNSEILTIEINEKNNFKSLIQSLGVAGSLALIGGIILSLVVIL